MAKQLKIKVCGMREKSNISQLCELSPDYIGFLFYPKSKRYVGQKIPEEILRIIPKRIKKVGVFVNEDFQDLEAKIRENQLDFVQLHGDETPEYCEMANNLGIDVIKSFSVTDDFVFNKLDNYKKHCNYFLFDTFTPAYGGSGEKFNWDILDKYDNETPFFLSGGISLNETDDILNLKNLNLHAIDINSRFEIEPALKDIIKVQEFIKAIRNG